MRVVFICSARYSGSTLLDLLLGSHPDACALGEITHLPKNLALNTACTCGSAARECEFWTRVVDELAEYPQFRGIRSDPYVLHLGSIHAGYVVDTRHQTRLRLIRRKLLYALAQARFRWKAPIPAAWLEPLYAGARNKFTLFEVISRLTSRSVLVDSSKHYLEAVSLYRHDPESVRIVLLIRDGRAAYYSALKRGNARKAALQPWAATYRRALPILENCVPEAHRIQVRYEDLADDPQKELKRLCSFIGIEFAPEMLEYAARERHVLNGNRILFAPRVEIVPDLSWQRALSPSDTRYFDARAGRLNKLLGYG